MTPAARTYLRIRRYSRSMRRDREAYYTDTARRYLAHMKATAAKGAA